MDIYKLIYKKINGHCLFLESFASFFIVSGAELALQLRNKGTKVSFCYISSKIPAIDIDESFIKKIFLCGVENHNQIMMRILKKNGVNVLEPPNLSKYKLAKCVKFSKDFPKELDHLKTYCYAGVPLGLSVVSTMINNTRNSRFKVLSFQRKIEKMLLSSAIVYERSKILLSQLNPDYTILFNGRSATSFPVEQAVIKSSSHPIWRETQRSHRSERIILLDKKIHSSKSACDAIKKVASDIKIKTLSQKAKTFFKNEKKSQVLKVILKHIKNKKIPTIQPKNPVITYFHSSEDEFAATENFRQKFCPNQLSAVKKLDEILSPIAKSINFFVRIHPHLTKKNHFERKIWDNFKVRNGTLIKSTDTYDSQELLKKSNLIITYGSSLTARANFFEKPVICLNQNSIFSKLGIAVCPKSNIQLKKAISSLLKKKKCKVSLNTLKYAYYNYIHVKLGIKFIFFKYNPSKNAMIYKKNINLSMNSKLWNILRTLYHNIRKNFTRKSTKKYWNDEFKIIYK